MKNKVILVLAPMVAILLCRLAAADFELTVNLVGPGRIDPNAGTYAEGTVVAMQVWPDDGYWVKSWSGTDDDSSTELTNTVTMDSNTTVVVELGPAIVVTRPSEGDVWAAGSRRVIRWWSYGAGNVDILFSKNGGISWQALAVGTADTGEYVWDLPSSLDAQRCLVLVEPTVFDANVTAFRSGEFAIRPYLAGPSAGSDWKSLAGDFDRRGQSSFTGLETGCVKWEFEVDGAISASVTIGPNDTLYIPCEDGNLYTLDANGSLLWTYEMNSPLISAATLGPDGTAYVGNKDGRLCAIDIEGNLRWTLTTDGPVYSSPAVSPDGNSIYACSEDGRLYALARDGSELWSFETGAFSVIDGAILASPAVGPNGTVYIGGLYDSNLYALDPNNGSTKWVCDFNSEGWLFASPVISPDGTIYQTLLYDPNVYAIDANNGNIIWATNLAQITEQGSDSYSRWFEPYYYDTVHFDWRAGVCADVYSNAFWNVSDSGWSEPVIGPDGTIYISFDDPWLRVVEPNGTIRQILKLGSDSGFCLTAADDGLVYAGSDDSNLYAVNQGGYEIARFDTNDHWLSFPVVSPNNTLLVSDSRDNSLLISYENNRVWAIGSEGCEGELDLYWQGGPQDLYRDGVVNYTDLAIVAADWLRCTECIPFCGGAPPEQQFLEGDVNRDLYINFKDYAIVAERWLSGN